MEREKLLAHDINGICKEKLREPLSIFIKYKATVTMNEVSIFDSTFRLYLCLNNEIYLCLNNITDDFPYWGKIIKDVCMYMYAHDD